MAQAKPGGRDGATGDNRIRISTHAELRERQAEIFRRLNADPETARRMMLNPSIAMKEAGIDLSPRVATHVLHVLQHDEERRARLRELRRRLKAALGEPPQPRDPEWLAGVLFDRLELEPLSTKGADPVFRDPLPPEHLERAQARRPAMRPAPATPRRLHGTTLRLAPWRPAFRRLDLEAPAPELKRARRRPARIELVELWFYKDRHETARELLELGVLEHRGFPIQPPGAYREIVSGERDNALARWITSVRFKDEPPA